MVSCDLCHYWFHGTCVGLPNTFRGEYVCAKCREKFEKMAGSEVLCLYLTDWKCPSLPGGVAVCAIRSSRM